MALTETIKSEIDEIIASADVVLFMKGRKSMPQCGFSATVIQILNEHTEDYKTVNVLANTEIREGIKSYSNWPTIPQLYVRGEFVGGCDIVKDLHGSGELEKLIGVSTPVDPPTVELSDGAVAALDAAREGDEPKQIRFTVSPNFEYGLQFDDKQASDFVVESNGYTIVVDRSSARRAQGVTVDFLDSSRGGGFKIANPAEPPKVQPILPADLKAKMAEGDKVELFDVRTADERARAVIEGSKLLDEPMQQYILALPKETALYFHCHHGPRSANAANYFLQQGFTKVFNLVGGIDAWSIDADSNVPRY